MARCSFVRTLKVLVALLVIIPVFLIWVVLMMEAIRAEHSCPENCSCAGILFAVDCTNTSLQDIPLGLQSYTDRLVLSDNNINTLSKESFVKYNVTKLHIILLDNNHLVNVEVGAFRGLPKLKYIHLNSNNITYIHPNVFLDLPNLEYLELSNNHIKVLQPEMFRHLEALEYLDLGKNNIVNITEDVFVGLNNVKDLILSGNELRYLESDLFKYLPKLKNLILNDNKKLTVPTERSFLNIHTLTSCSLVGCNIKDISVKTFQMLPNLKQLDLRNNSLTTIDINIVKMLPHLSTLSLYGNSLHCDCRLKDLWLLCQERSIKSVYTQTPLCDSPGEVSGLVWNVLGKSDCSSENITFINDYKSAFYEDDSFVYKYHYHHSVLTYLEPTVYGLLFLFGATGNIIVLVIIACNGRMQTLPNAYILNLAIGDLLNLLTNLPFYYIVVNTAKWTLGKFLCRFGMFFLKLSIAVSAFSVTVLSIQRYYATSGSVNLSTKRSTVIIIASVWLIASCCALPSAFSVGIEHGFCSPIFNWMYYEMVRVFDLIVFCLIPLVVIVSMYFMAARQLVRRAQQDEAESRTYKTLAKIVIGLAVVFFFSFVPYHVFEAFNIIYYEFGVYTGYAHFVAKCLLVMNSCFNPVALYCTSATYKKLFKHYLLCFRRSTQEDEESDLCETKQGAVLYRRDVTDTDVI